MKNELLRPSLSPTFVIRPLYTTTSMFYVAFLGGVIAVVLYSVLNIRRMQRLKKDFWLLVLGFFLSVMFLFVAFGLFGQAPGSPRIYARILGFIYVGCFYFRYRSFFRIATFNDEERPSPLLPALISILVAAIVPIIFAFLKPAII